MSEGLKKILFIDDDEDIHMVVRLCFRDMPGLDFRAAISGEEGIQMAMDFLPDLILLDVMMPKMDGIATLQAMKHLPKLSKTPIVFFTAKAQKSDVEQYFKYGVEDVIVKPFDPMTLSKTVQTIWERFQSKSG